MPPDAPRPPGARRAAVVANPTKHDDITRLRDTVRAAMSEHGWDEPVWLETTAEDPGTGQAAQAVRDGVDLVLACGGDGTVTACANGVAGSGIPLGILPLGTGNLLARNLGLPMDIEGAVAVGLHGARRRLDVGRFNKERFAVMAGVGIDAAMIRDADGILKERLGRAAYVWTGLKNLRAKPVGAEITVDGVHWFSGESTCVLIGNVGSLFAGIEVFSDASPDDGLLDVGVVTMIETAMTRCR